jgi:glycosyltransferase involved in cell wall biosynthesis
MRAVFFDFCTTYGGAPKGTICLARRLTVNHDVHIIDAYGSCKMYCEHIKEVGLPLHILDPNAKKTTIGYNNQPLARMLEMAKQFPVLRHIQKQLIKNVLEINPDVIWVNNEKSLVLLSSSYRLKKYPLVIYIRGWATPDQVKICLRWLLKHKVKAIIAHAKATLAQLKLAGIPDDKLHYTANAIDFDEIEQESRKPLDLNLPGVDKWPKILLASARPVREKGHLAAVKAISHLKRQGYNPALWLPGEVAAGVDKTFVQQLKERIQDLNINENVFFIGWYKNFPALIKACDIMLLPSHTEGFPRVIVEAMYLKKPVCATPVGGIPEAIIDGRTGYLFDLDDDIGMAKVLATLIDKPELRNKITEQAYCFALDKFKLDDHTSVVAGVFESVISRQ